MKIAAHAPKMPKITKRASFYSHVNPIWWQRSPISLPLNSFYGNSEAKLPKPQFFSENNRKRRER
jgi:hypothetical protein